MVLIVSSFTAVLIFFCEISKLVYTSSPFFSTSWLTLQVRKRVVLNLTEVFPYAFERYRFQSWNNSFT
jgi:hypothetical protein